MVAQWSWPFSPASSISQHAGQVINLFVARHPSSSSVAEQDVSPLSSRLCGGHMDDVLQPQHQLLFWDQDTVVELALKSRKRACDDG